MEAQDFGDWYDVDQVLGLLNAVAVAQSAAVRVVALPAEGQTSCVLMAPREAVLEGIETGLLRVGAAGEGMQVWKAAEKQAIERLREEIPDLME